jgi:hypothetical protein
VAQVRKTASADAALKVLEGAPRAIVEILNKVAILEAEGLRGELLIGIVNDRHDVHLVDCAYPAPSLLTISDPQRSQVIWLAGFHRVRNLTQAVKRTLALRAAASIGVIAYGIAVV